MNYHLVGRFLPLLAVLCLLPPSTGFAKNPETAKTQATAPQKDNTLLPGTWKFQKFYFEETAEEKPDESLRRGEIAMTKDLLSQDETWILTEKPQENMIFFEGDRRFLDHELQVMRSGKLRSKGSLVFKKFKYFEYTLEKYPGVIYRCGLRKFTADTFSFALYGTTDQSKNTETLYRFPHVYIFTREKK